MFYCLKKKAHVTALLFSFSLYLLSIYLSVSFFLYFYLYITLFDFECCRHSGSITKKAKHKKTLGKTHVSTYKKKLRAESSFLPLEDNKSQKGKTNTFAMLFYYFLNVLL